MQQIAFITDTHLDETFPIKNGVNARKNWGLIQEDLAFRNINELIFGGDIGKKEANQWFFDSLKDFKTHVILGNHDCFDEVKKHYENSNSKSNKELFYGYEEGWFKYIFLDTSSAQLSQDQLKWLTSEIQTDKKILLLMHHPLLKIDSPVDRSYPLKGREEIKDLLNASKNEITIMCGHYHTDDEQTEGNIRQITTPAASYQIKKHTETTEVDNDIFGYRVILIHNDSINTDLMLYKDGQFVVEETFRNR